MKKCLLFAMMLFAFAFTTQAANEGDFGDLHTVGDGDGIEIHIRQASGTGNHGADGAGADGVEQNLAGGGCKLLADFALECRNTHDTGNGQHRHDGDHCDEDPASSSLLILSKGFEECVILRNHCFFLFTHSYSFHDSWYAMIVTHEP